MDESKLQHMVHTNLRKQEYPSILNLDEGDLKDIKDWQVGKTYKVLLTIKQVSSSTGETLLPSGDSDAKMIHGRFEVVKAELPEDETPENETD